MNVLNLDAVRPPPSLPERMLTMILLLALRDRAFELRIEPIAGTVKPEIRVCSVAANPPDWTVTASDDLSEMVTAIHHDGSSTLVEYHPLPADPGRWVIRELERLADAGTLRKRLARLLRVWAAGIDGLDVALGTGQFQIRLPDHALAWNVCMEIFPSRDWNRLVLHIASAVSPDSP